MTNNDIISAIKAMKTSSRESNRPVKGYKIHHGKTPKYEAQIGIGSSKIYLGMFDSPEKATAAYTAAKAKIAEMRNHGD